MFTTAMREGPRAHVGSSRSVDYGSVSCFPALRSNPGIEVPLELGLTRCRARRDKTECAAHPSAAP